jgi:hypothetical protein
MLRGARMAELILPNWKRSLIVWRGQLSKSAITSLAIPGCYANGRDGSDAASGFGSRLSFRGSSELMINVTLEVLP